MEYVILVEAQLQHVLEHAQTKDILVIQQHVQIVTHKLLLVVQPKLPNNVTQDIMFQVQEVVYNVQLEYWIVQTLILINNVKQDISLMLHHQQNVLVVEQGQMYVCQQHKHQLVLQVTIWVMMENVHNVLDLI